MPKYGHGAATRFGTEQWALWPMEPDLQHRLKETLESRFGWILNHNGAIYAFRRDEYTPIPNGTIVDDLMIPLLMRLHHEMSRLLDDNFR